jgi:8-oxo-dGTP diphosphatase
MQKTIDKLAWIYLVNGRILSTRSKGKQTYYIPGGKREGSETDQEALLREIKEELSIDLRPETIEFFGKFKAQAHGKAEGVLVQMTCYTAGFVGEIQAAAEIEEVVWFSYADKARTSPVDHIIFDFLQEKGLLK